ncbi:MAG: Coenzyme F420 hydrogenase/dehydrogenase, beta subunit C-terminal domain [Clostridia bacterium]|nr:Coenzyme F420 hydrogenase/dehydrogenase, beta subunit C-terminal domain [Clostridia bacterium]
MNICPKKAIVMTEDHEGFLYPSVKEALCIQCGMCEKVCPVSHPPKINEHWEYGAVVQNQRKDVLKESTSGGFIDALCEDVVVRQRGFVVGVAFDEDFLPVHKIAETAEQTVAFRNSKYAQSILGETFVKVKSLLQKEKTVLFIGTPCQVAGLKSYLQQDYTRLITVDLVCRSIPSPKLWKKYLEWQQNRYGSGIVSVACRRKTYGYHSGALEIEFTNGRRYAGSNRVDYFMKCFHSDLCSRPSCYHCSFKTVHRCSDFTVFDSWNPFAVTEGAVCDNDSGYSNVIVHTNRGKQMLEQLKQLDIVDADVEKMFVYTGGMERKSVTRKPEREELFGDLETLGFEKTMKKYVRVTVFDRMIETAKPLRYALKKAVRK